MATTPTLPPSILTSVAAAIADKTGGPAPTLSTHPASSAPATPAASPASPAPSSPAPAAPAAPAATEPVPTPTTPATPEAPAAPGDPAAPAPEAAPAPASAPTPADDDDFAFSDEAPPAGQSPQPPQAGEGESPPPPSNADDTFEGLLPAEVEAAFLRTNRGKHLLNTYKTIRELRADPSQGGIGFLPTVDQIKAFHASHSELIQMEAEFESNPASWIANHFTPDPTSGQLRPGAEQVLNALLPTVKKANPNLYYSAVTPIFRSFVETAYTDALALPEGSPEREELLAAAQVSERRLFGRARDITKLKPPAPEDPLVVRQRELDERQRILDEREQASRRTVAESFGDSIGESILASVTADLREALKPLAGIYPEAGLNDIIKSSIAEQVLAKVRSNAPVFNEFQSRLRAAQRAVPSTPGERARVISDLTAFYRPLAREVIRNLRPNLLRDYGGKAIVSHNAQAAQQEAVLAQAATHTAPVAAGQPAPQSVAVPTTPQRQPNESHTDFIARQLRDKMASARQAVPQR